MSAFEISIQVTGGEQAAEKFRQIGENAEKAGTAIAKMAADASTYENQQKQLQLLNDAYENQQKQLQLLTRENSKLEESGKGLAIAFVTLAGKLSAVLLHYNKLSAAQLILQSGFGKTAQSLASLALRITAWTAAVYFSIKALFALKEAVEESYDRMEILQRTLTELANIGANTEAFDRLVDSSIRLGIGIESLKDSAATFYTVRREIGLTVDQVQKLVDTVIMVGRVGGNSQQNIQAVLETLSQGLAAGEMEAENLKKILSNMPLLSKMLSDELAKGGKSLREMARDGELTSQVMAKGLLAIYEKISATAGKLPQTIEESENSLKVQQDLLAQYLGSWTNILDTSKIYNNILAEGAKIIRWTLGGMTEYEKKLKQIGTLEGNIVFMQRTNRLAQWMGLDWLTGKSNQWIDDYRQKMQEVNKELSTTIPEDQRMIFEQQFGRIEDLIGKFKDQFAPQKTELEKLVMEYNKLLSVIETSLIAETADQQQKKANAINLLKTLRDETKARLDAAEAQKKQTEAAKEQAEANRVVQSILNSVVNLSPQIREIVRQASQIYKVPPEILYAVIGAESGGNINAVSTAGAQGLMQLMPATARNLGVQNPFDPFQNIMGGAKLLSQLMSTYNDLRKVLSAYNSGKPEGRAEETVNYVKNVTAAYQLLRQGVVGNLDANDALAASQEALNAAEENLRGELNLSTEAFIEKVAAAEELRRSLNPLIEAQEKYNKNIDLANFLLENGRIGEEQYTKFLVDQADLLEKTRHPNAERIKQLQTEIELYERAKAQGLTSAELQQQLAIQQEIEKLNPADLDYAQQIKQIEQMIPELERLKEEFGAVNAEAEIFKAAAQDIFKTWTDAFERIFDQGLKGFKGFFDTVIQIFKRTLAQLATLTLNQNIIAPFVRGLGSLFGLSSPTLDALMKHLGAGGGQSAGAGGTGLWESIAGFFGFSGGQQQTAAAAVAGTGSFDARWAARTGQTPPTQVGVGMGGFSTYGMAGMGGYMAGSYIGGGTTASQIGGAAGAIGGAYLGATYGTMLGPWGTVVGAMIGAIAGAVLGGLFSGGEGKQKLVLRSGGDEGQYDIAGGVRMMETTALGTFGFDQATKNMDEWLSDQGQKIMQSVKEADATIAALLKPEELERTRAALKDWRYQGKNVEQGLMERYRLIIESSDVTWKELAQAGTSLEDLLKNFANIRALEEFILKDMPSEISKEFETDYARVIDSMRENTTRLLEVLERFKGDASDLETITKLIQDRYNLEIQALKQVRAAAESINDSIDTTTESIKESTMNQSELYAYLTEQAQTLAGSISSMSDPTKIQETISRITAIVNQAYGLLTPEQRATVGQQFIDWLNAIGDLSGDQLTGIEDTLLSEHDLTVAALKEALDAGTEGLVGEFRAVGDAIIAAIEKLTPAAAMASGGWVPGTWNGRAGIAGDTVITAMTPGEAVIPRAIAQRHRGLLGALFTGQVRYMANGTEEEYVAYLRDHLGEYFPGENRYVNYIPGKEFEVRQQEKGPDSVLAGVQWLWDWMSKFDLPRPEPTPPPEAPPAPEPPPAPEIPSLPELPPMGRGDLKAPIEQMITSIRGRQLSAAQRMPGWNELAYQQGQVSSAQTQLADATTPEEQLAALQKLEEAVQGRYNAEIAEIDRVWQEREQQLNEEIQTYQALEEAAKSIKGYVDSLKLSELTTLKPKERLDEASRQYQETLQKAQSGDVQAAQELQGKAEAYLQESRSFYASGGQYKDIFAQVTGQLEQFSSSAQAEAAAKIKAAQDELAKGPDYSPAFEEMNASLSEIAAILARINEENQVGAETGYNPADINQYIQPMASGGMVKAALTPGEAVIGAGTVRQHSGLVRAILNDQVTYAAEGLPPNVIPFTRKEVAGTSPAGASSAQSALDAVKKAIDALTAVVMATTQKQTGDIVAATDRVAVAVHEVARPLIDTKKAI